MDPFRVEPSYIGLTYQREWPLRPLGVYVMSAHLSVSFVIFCYLQFRRKKREQGIHGVCTVNAYNFRSSRHLMKIAHCMVSFYGERVVLELTFAFIIYLFISLAFVVVEIVTLSTINYLLWRGEVLLKSTSIQITKYV